MVGHEMAERHRSSTDDLKGLLREHGLRITAPRIIMLEALRSGEGHMSAEEIYGAVLAQYPSINLVTVYRTLESFEERGLASRVDLGDKLTRWEWTGAAHHHLVCRHCGDVVELDDEPFRRLAADLARVRGVRADVRHLALPGLCAVCAAADPESDS
jgi:Fur family ferric uptake transcriptional regulator